MKKVCELSGLITIAVIILMTVSCFGQDLSKRTSLKLHNESLQDAITAISNKENIKFSYNPQSLPLSKRISVNLKDRSLKEILDVVFKQNGIEYYVVENQIILKPMAVSANNGAEVRTDVIVRKSLSGFLRDKANGEILIGASVYVKGKMTGVTTNVYGFYSLTLPVDTYQIVFSYIGYNAVNQEINLIKDIALSIDLEAMRIEMNAVEVSSDNKETGIHTNQLSEVHFSPRILSQLPGFVGNIDVIKALQAVPGIKSYGDGSTLFYVRGGNSDQNLIMIDDAPIYNPSHLFGFFSAFSPDAIKEAEAFKGDFPANYGGRLSSVIDIRSRDGNMKRFGFSGSAGPLTSNLSFEGPIHKDKSSFFISGRRSNMNWLQLNGTTDKTLTINFYDVNAKLNFRINNKNRVYFTFYSGKDDFSRLMASSVHTFGISWDNVLGTLRWNHVYSNKLFSNTTAYFSRYNYFLFISKQLDDYWTSSISNRSLKTDFSWFIKPGNTLKMGAEVSFHTSNPGNVHFSDPDIQNNAPEISKYRSVEYTASISNELKISKKVSVRYGIRLPIWLDLGPATVYSLNTNYGVSDTREVPANHQYAAFISPEPRITFTYGLSERSALKASYTRNTQFMQQLSNSESPFTSLEVWAPSGPNILPQKADLYAAGYFVDFGRRKFNLSVEAFYKDLWNQIEYKDHANMLYNPLIEGELRFGKAWSYGLEFMLRKSEGRFNGWIGYTYSRVFKKVADINSGKIFPALHDRPNDICINLSWQMSQRFAITANWIYLTGSPITAPVGFYNYNGYTIPVYGEKNNERLPDYHRLDLNLTFKLNRADNKYQHSIVLALYNACGRYNAFTMSFNKITDDKGNFVIPTNLNGTNEIIPTNISVSGVIPSLSYNFKF